jgi:transcriptional regulatory protein LEU3
VTDTFQLNCARIHVLAFHFFAHPTQPGPDIEALSRLFSLCVSTLQAASTMIQQTNFAFISQSFIDRTLQLAGFCILKLCRSPIAQHLDATAGERAYSTAAQFSKSTSLQKGDIGERCAAILTNLWGSTKIFRRKDGSVESLGIRLRTRLSMSVSFDMFWYWREEFGHTANPYNDDEAIPSNAQSQPTTPGKLKFFTIPPHRLIARRLRPRSQRAHPTTTISSSSHRIRDICTDGKDRTDASPES